MNQIKELRKENKIGQKQLAHKLGCSKSTVSHYENNKRSITTKKSRDIHRAMLDLGADCEYDDLFPPEQAA